MDAHNQGARAPDLAAPHHNDAVAESEMPPGKVASLERKGQDNEHCDSASVADSRKAWLNVQALCLLAGFNATLIDGNDGQPLLVVSRWALCKSFSSIADIEAWLTRVGGEGA